MTDDGDVDGEITCACGNCDIDREELMQKGKEALEELESTSKDEVEKR